MPPSAADGGRRVVRERTPAGELDCATADTPCRSAYSDCGAARLDCRHRHSLPSAMSPSLSDRVREPLVLVSHALCPYVQRAAIVMDEKGVAFIRRDIDLSAK